MIDYLIKIGLSLLLSSLIGSERERNDKPAGLRTIMSICLGATLVVIFSLELSKTIKLDFDIMRAIAYYLVAIGFVGGGIIGKDKRNKTEGITTASILLPVTLTGFFCGLGIYEMAITTALCIYGILMLKYVKIKFEGWKNDKS